jgi:fumarylacetoacetase
MGYSINKTHDAGVQSWVTSANDPATDFPIQNLPFGIFRRSGEPGQGRTGIAIGDRIFDLAAGLSLDLLDSHSARIVERYATDSLNDLMAAGKSDWSALRNALSRLFEKGGLNGKNESEVEAKTLIRMSEAEMLLPAHIGDYTDFYASIHHATNIGKMFRPDSPLMPNYKWVPIGYHGRASSVVVSGTAISRPFGQTKADDAESPVFGPSKVMDYELEVGCFVGVGNTSSYPIKIADAEDHIFGFCMVNDWSARDIQRWEYQPLGPFLSKSFATAISPWIVTPEALAPFRSPEFDRPAGDPRPLAYLDSAENRQSGGLDMTLDLYILTPQMRERNIEAFRICRSNTRNLYWTFAQMVSHHTSNGCNLRPGDLLASGTVSGPAPDSVGSLMERTERGTVPIKLPTGEERRFLQDGDEIIYRAFCERRGFRRIGFGECRGAIIPSVY